MKQSLVLLKKYKTSRLVIAFILFWTPIIIFARLAGEVLERQPIGPDITILEWIHSISTSFLDTFFLVVTTMGNVEYILPVTILLIAYFLYKKQKLNALIIFFGMGGAAAANIILKLLFHRDRPSFWQSAITEMGYSFPSGHAMLSMALVLCLIVILWSTRWRILSVLIGGLFVLLVGFSRLYMGVHYPTDIIAGWSVSFLWIVIVALIAKQVLFTFRINVARK